MDAVSDYVGKGVFATRDFLAGETIFRERPLVSAQVRQKGRRICSVKENSGLGYDLSSEMKKGLEHGTQATVSVLINSFLASKESQEEIVDMSESKKSTSSQRIYGSQGGLN